jgi:small subunit ribosomal protein S19
MLGWFCAKAFYFALYFWIFFAKHHINSMSRSLKKGPYVDPRVIKKIEGKIPRETGVIKTWSRACVIAPEMVGFIFGVHNGKSHLEVFVTEDMVGHRLGEFSPTKKFVKHGGKMQKELEIKKKEGEIAAAQAAKTTADTKK